MSTWTVSRVPTIVSEFMEIASLLDRWTHIAEDNEKILEAAGEKRAAYQTFELFMVAEMASGFIRKYAGDLELEKIPVTVLQGQVEILVVKNEIQETRAVAVLEVRGPKKVWLDCLVSHPENIPSSLAKRVSGAASAAIQYLQATNDEIELSSGNTAVAFYKKHRFVQLLGNSMVYSKGAA